MVMRNMNLMMHGETSLALRNTRYKRLASQLYHYAVYDFLFITFCTCFTSFKANSSYNNFFLITFPILLYSFLLVVQLEWTNLSFQRLLKAISWQCVPVFFFQFHTFNVIERKVHILLHEKYKIRFIQCSSHSSAANDCGSYMSSRSIIRPVNTTQPQPSTDFRQDTYGYLKI